jgi:hypothetical protein
MRLEADELRGIGDMAIPEAIQSRGRNEILANILLLEEVDIPVQTIERFT